VRKAERISMVQKKNWSFKEQRHLIELARALKPLDQVAKEMKRKPEAVKRMAIRLGVSFKSRVKKQ
jgi:hypothetical protein